MQGQVPGVDQPAAASDLPAEILAAVFRWLDHDSLFCALSACKAWHAAGAAEDAGALWQPQCAARGWRQPPAQTLLPVAAAAAAGGALAGAADEQWAAGMGQQWQQQQQPAAMQEGAAALQEQQLPGPQEQPPPYNWKEHYRKQYCRVCFDCFQPTDRRTLAAGSLRIRLCRGCSLSYTTPRPQHRMLSSSRAKRDCCLNDKGGCCCWLA